MQIGIMVGNTAEDGSLKASYPVNLEPRAVSSQVSEGQLVTTRGTKPFAIGPGTDRGGIAWNGVLYRAMGSRLVAVWGTGEISDIGEIGNDNHLAGFDYGFGRLAVRSAGQLFYYNGTTLTQVTDTDLGEVADMIWMDGYFVTTDNTSIVVTQLSDPSAVDPLKYGSAEEDPDMIVGLLKYREELYVFGRNTIQVFDNTGGSGFPFSAVQGATIPYGVVGPDAKCRLRGSFAFVGGGRADPIGIYLYAQGAAQRISSREIDEMLNAHPSPELIEMESRDFGGEEHILVHLEDRTVGFAVDTSQKADDGAWFVLHSGEGGAYRPRNAVWCYGQHIIGDLRSNALCCLSGREDTHFGAAIEWRFDAALLFDGKPFLAKAVELFGQFPTEPSAITLTMSRDGVLWSREVARKLDGRRAVPVRWQLGTRVQALAAMRWRGSGRIAIARAEIDAEPLHG